MGGVIMYRGKSQKMASGVAASRSELSMLVGIPSSIHARREAFRCSLRAQPTCARCRHVFILGHDRTAPPDLRAADVLQIDVQEGLQAYLPAAAAARHRGSFTGSLTGALKVALFLRHAAAHARERIIGRLDDDLFVAFPALEAYAAALLRGAWEQRTSPTFVAGTFEYSSFIPSRLAATGWGLNAAWAGARGRRLHNCSRITPGTHRHTEHCYGPFAFAKGPLQLFSHATVRRLVSDETTFAIDVRDAESRFRHLNASMVHDDIQTGYWLARASIRATNSASCT